MGASHPAADGTVRSVRLARWLAASVLLCLSLPAAALNVPILVYHRFGAEATDSMTVRTAAFEGQLARIKAGGYRVIPLRQLIEHLLGRAPPPPLRSIVITVDDAHRSVYTQLLPLARRHRLPFTLFVYPSAISNAAYAMTWEQLEALRDSGLADIQSHTYWHPNLLRERRQRTPEDFARFADWQLRHSREVLERRLGIHVDLLAWPFGLQDADLRARAARAGYVAAFTLEHRPVRAGDDLLALPRYLITDAVRPAAFAAILQQAGPPAGGGGTRP